MGDGTGLALRTTLANFYPLVADMRMIAKDAGLSTGNIDLSGKPIVAWFNLLEYAEAQVKHDAVVARALLDYPENDVLKRASEHRPPPPVLEGPKAEWEGPAAPATLEKLMGYRSTLVNISYLERGLSRAGAVVRIQRQDGGSGTGFLLDGDILVTNNHVLPDLESARTAIAQFNYQLTIDGLNAPVETFNLALDDFFRTNHDDDWTAVKVAGNPGRKWGALKLAARTPDVGEHVNIIQHAGGGPKQVSLSANVVAFVGHGRVQYLTDTLPGSSGSPVFDADWNVIALHHSGGWITEPNAQSKSLFYRNEGIAIDRIIDGLAAG